MTFIDHNCECGHPVVMHGPVESSRERACHCGCVSARPAESVVIETMDDNGTRMPMTQPGARVPIPPPRLMACDCEQCVALYATVGAS